MSISGPWLWVYNEARVKLHVKMNSLDEVFVKLPWLVTSGK
jgi:hypothetical protein